MKIETMEAQLLAYSKAVANYERGIKRLRKLVWRGRNDRARIRQLEDLVISLSCGMDLDACAKLCPAYSIRLHGEARDILARRKQ